MFDQFNFKSPTIIGGWGTTNDIGPPILVRVETEIYRSRFLFIPFGEWKEALEYTYTLQVFEPALTVVLRCWDTTDYKNLLGVVIKEPIKVWGQFYHLDSQYYSNSCIKLIDNLRRFFKIYPPDTNCRGIINYVRSLPLTTRLRFLEKEVYSGKVFFSEKLGRGLRTKE